MRSMQRCRLFAVLLTFVSVSFPAVHSQAAVIGTGCAGGTVCTLQELLDGGSLQIDDKLFSNFRGYTSVATGGADPIFPNLTRVTDYKVFGGFGIPSTEIGLVFFDFGLPSEQGTILTGGQTQTTSWTYTVTTLGPLIEDNTLLMSGGGFADVPAGASVVINETASAPGGPGPVARKSVFEDTSGLQTQDHRVFSPVSTLDIFTSMSLNGGPDPADTSINTQVLFLVETFSQQRVPEPGTVVLLAIGLVALIAVSRRDRS